MSFQWFKIFGAAALGAAVLALGFFIQHLRHGWPFSLHHGVAVSGTQAIAAPAVAIPSSRPERVAIELATEQLASSGVTSEPAKFEAIGHSLRAVATIAPDEARIAHVHTRVAGWIERLDVKTTGQRVRAGQSVAGVFSQELLASQQEYLAVRRANVQGASVGLVQGARSRLKVLGLSDSEIQAIEKSGEAQRLIGVIAPISGVVVHRGVAVGTSVDPSTELMTIADLSQVWVLAEVPEADIPRVSRDTQAELEFSASGLPPFEAKVEFLYPTLTERTRTLQVRFSVPNKTGELRPGLYGTANFNFEPHSALTVPRDAVVDTGESQHVFVAHAGGHFEPRIVKLGTRLQDRVEVLEGLSPGEEVVASGVFLIDSESRLRASGGGTGHVHSAPADTRAEAAKAPAVVDHSQHSGH
jgi:Cu(I)/Ag(I) efflux system membrane fusion protein